MTDIFTVVGLSIVTLCVALFLKQYRAEYALIVSLVGSSIIALFVLGEFFGIKEELNQILKSAEIDSEVLKITFKALGICFITSFASSFCKDFGLSSLSGKVELAGRVTVVVLTLPLIRRITQIALELIG